jgi:hypothetical protein
MAMTNLTTTRIRTLAAVAVLGGGLTLTACSSDSSGGDTAAVTSGACKLGDTVGEPATKGGVPPCAANSDAKTHTYGCQPDPGAPPQGSWYTVEYSDGIVLYGKPGGEWTQAEGGGKPEPDVVQQIGC